MLAVLIGSAAMTAEAQTIGYWRFENSSNVGIDSSGNGYNLTNVGTVPSLATVFPNPVPQNNLANTRDVDIESGSSQYLTIADSAAFAVQDFTIESYVQVESIGGSSSAPRIIASQADQTGNNVAWQFGVAGTGSAFGTGGLFLQLSKTGGSGTLQGLSSGFTLTPGSNYYVAATVDFTIGSGVSVKFYFQNLTLGTAMQTVTATNAIDSMYDSTANFAIGASFNSGTAARYFDGQLDEVRLSNTALSQSALLAVPEPSVVALAVLGAGAMIFLRRRKRQVIE